MCTYRPSKSRQTTATICSLDIEKELVKCTNEAAEKLVKIPLYGIFNQRGIMVLQRFHRLKRLRTEVEFEKALLQNTFHLSAFREEGHYASFIRQVELRGYLPVILRQL